MHGLLTHVLCSWVIFPSCLRCLGGRKAGQGTGLKRAEKLPYPETLLKTQEAPRGTKGVERKDENVNSVISGCLGREHHLNTTALILPQNRRKVTRKLILTSPSLPRVIAVSERLIRTLGNKITYLYLPCFVFSVSAGLLLPNERQGNRDKNYNTEH